MFTVVGMTYKTGRSGMLSRTAVRRTAAVVATAALAGAALAACGDARHGGAGASGAVDGRGRSHAPSAGASGATPGIPAQRTAPPETDRTGPSGIVPSQTVPGQRTAPGPRPPASPAAPSSAGARGDSAPAGKSVALTFDDGPDPRWTPQILALLAEHHARATFCEIGPNAAAHPSLVRRITAEGHRLCDHSVHHDERQSSRSLTYNTHEIADAQHDIARAAGPGAKLWYYRAPGGDFTPPIRHIAADHGLRPLGWTVDSRDWERPGTGRILDTVGSELRPGSIVLMHDGGGDRTQTVQALSRLLDTLDAQGWTYSFPAR
jgi:peptidoglycan/xylan/chitin deacetylase (PgdA/CDA1 family)